MSIKRKRHHRKKLQTELNQPVLIGVEPLEQRLVLSSVTGEMSPYVCGAPELPGLQLDSPDITPFHGQVFFLDWDGADDVTYNGPDTIHGIDIPPFQNTGDASNEDVKDEVRDSLNQIYADTGVRFTNVQPEEAEELKKTVKLIRAHLDRMNVIQHRDIAAVRAIIVHCTEEGIPE